MVLTRGFLARGAFLFSTWVEFLFFFIFRCLRPDYRGGFF
jgi:hypothetical protein